MAALGGLSLALSGCLEPTQITLELSTDADCDQIRGTAITVGLLGAIEDTPPAAQTTACEPQSRRIGSLAAVPSEDDAGSVAFRVVTSLGPNVDECQAPDYGLDCIVARRALSYLPHEALQLPIWMREACAGVICPPDETCIDGVCRPAEIDLATCIDNNICGPHALPSPPPATAWALGIGGNQHDVANGMALAGGGLYITGQFGGLVDFGSGALEGRGTQDGFIARFSLDGTHHWVQPIGNPAVASPDYGEAVAVDDHGNVFATGLIDGLVDLGGGPIGSTASPGQAFVASWSRAGAHRWSVAFGGETTTAHALGIAVDGQGHTHVTGHFYETITVAGQTLTSANGTQDILLTSFDSTGALLRAHRFGGSGSDDGWALAAGDDGVVLTGAFTSSVDLGGGSLSSEMQDGFVARFDVQGNHVWSRQLGAWPIGESGGVALDDDGNSYVTGSYEQAIDLGSAPFDCSALACGFLASFESQGQLRWAVRLGDVSEEAHGAAVAVSPTGEVFVSGSYAGPALHLGGAPLPAAQSDDIFVASFDAASGAHRWSLAAGGSDADVAHGVAVDAAGNAYFAGSLQGDLQAGATSLTAAGMRDIVLGRVVP